MPEENENPTLRMWGKTAQIDRYLGLIRAKI